VNPYILSIMYIPRASYGNRYLHYIRVCHLIIDPGKAEYVYIGVHAHASVSPQGMHMRVPHGLNSSMTFRKCDAYDLSLLI
jgi:hypothetical protein